MEASRDSETQQPEQPAAAAEPEAAAEGQKQDEEDESDLLTAKAQSLIDKITSNPENPSPRVLHALSTIIETEEAR